MCVNGITEKKIIYQERIILHIKERYEACLHKFFSANCHFYFYLHDHIYAFRLRREFLSYACLVVFSRAYRLWVNIYVLWPNLNRATNSISPFKFFETIEFLGDFVKRFRKMIAPAPRSRSIPREHVKVWSTLKWYYQSAFFRESQLPYWKNVIVHFADPV